MTSKREIESRLECLESKGDYPPLSFAELIAHAEADTLEPADRDRRLYRVDGELKQVPQEPLDILAEAADEES